MWSHYRTCDMVSIVTFIEKDVPSLNWKTNYTRKEIRVVELCGAVLGFHGPSSIHSAQPFVKITIGGLVTPDDVTPLIAIIFKSGYKFRLKDKRQPVNGSNK
ncbi:hypothetical protein TNCT_302901 [Trichonephila clavata]|uniref:Uncharacterized protein n=1 Tax=Trichonephila clavata TaxID=2740835 RepID=A0A8X6IBN1_TRICU|nr:hypothetical protein TNCT_302901 [Trichonephila clavata]